MTTKDMIREVWSAHGTEGTLKLLAEFLDEKSTDTGFDNPRTAAECARVLLKDADQIRYAARTLFS